MRSWERMILLTVGGIFLLSLIVLLGLILKSGAQKVVASFPTPTGYEQQFFEMRLLGPDLPSGYVRVNVATRLMVENGVGEQHIYEARPAIQLVQQIAIFPKMADVTTQMEKEIAHWSTMHFVFDGEARTSMPNADTVALACDGPVMISGRETLLTRYCMTIATYQNIYVVLSGSTVEGKLLTRDKYFELLGLLDERITKVQSKEVKAAAHP